jgi:hypothetical protein
MRLFAPALTLTARWRGRRKDIMDKVSSIDHFCQEMVRHVESGDFEALILAEADADLSNKRWACSHCSTEMSGERSSCTSCQACRAHGEPGCQACKH